MNLSDMTAGELLALSRGILSELRLRGAIRTGNAPAGDYAERLVQLATAGELAPNSQRSWDVRTLEGERLQVKARVVTDLHARGERQLSVFRSWDFDAAVIVLFDNDLRVWKAARVTVVTLREVARFLKHVNGYRVDASDDLLLRGVDYAPRLRDVGV